MARGYPDYANPVYSVASRNLDFSSLGMYISGIRSIDERGRVVFWDNFREGLFHWTAQAVGDGVAPVLTNGQPEIPPVSVGMNHGTVTFGGSSRLFYYVYTHHSLRLGLQVGIMMQSSHCYYDLYITARQGGADLGGSIRINGSTGQVSVRTAGAYLAVPGLVHTLASLCYTTVKFVVDLGTGFYDRFMIGPIEYDLSAYALYTDIAATEGQAQLRIWATGLDGSDPGILIGHTVFTIDEP